MILDSLSTPRTVALLAVTASVTVAQEVLLTRVLSVTTWYSLAFVVINLAMLGLTAGSLQAARAERDGKPLGPWLERRMMALAAALLIADAITVFTPLSFRADPVALAAMLVVIMANTLPFIAGGSVIARLMSRGGASIPTLYAVDLVAAAGGALVPLALLGPLSGPGAIALLAGAASLGSWTVSTRCGRVQSVALAAVALLVVGLTEFTTGGLMIRQSKGKSLRNTAAPPVVEIWNPLSYVTATAFLRLPMPIMWSPSPVFTPKGTYSASIATIDGDAWTPIYTYRDASQLNFLRYDAVTAAHVLRPRGTACVIGVGGGRDILAALNYGHPRVFGIEINPAMIDLLGRAVNVSPILRDPRVTIVTGDGRAVLARSSVVCSVLQASLIDTWAATSAGAFAHTEATLYTREAWGLFLRRVEPDGILTFSRWYRPGHDSETARLISLAMASLLDRGVSRPRDHIAIVASQGCATILVSPQALSTADRAALDHLEHNLRFELLVAPGRRSSDPLIEKLLEADSIEALGDAGAPYGLDTSAPTDDRPFFFQLVSPAAWLHPIVAFQAVQNLRGLGGGVIPGNVVAMAGMVLMLITVSAVGAFLLGPTLLASLRSPTPPLPGARAWVYFGCLGAGFMIAEIALVQRMHVVLGHPTYSLIVVLASLLVSTGIGSALSVRWIRLPRDISLFAAIAGILLALLPFLIIDPLASRTGDASLALRALWTAGCAAAVGILLGMFFPSGLRFTNRELGAPAALAVNGITSVLGGGAAVITSVALGIPSSFALAGIFYLIAALAGPARWRI
jgi:hypothetical protein